MITGRLARRVVHLYCTRGGAKRGSLFLEKETVTAVASVLVDRAVASRLTLLSYINNRNLGHAVFVELRL